MKTMMRISYKLQKGFSLVTAIFLLVVLGGLGAMMVTFFTAQQQSSALDVLGSRAYQAARTGVEWAAYNVAAQPENSLAAWAGCATGPVPPFSAGTLGGNLSPFAVAVTCNAASYVESASTIWVYNITSTATFGATPGSANYVERVISVKMGK